MPLLEALFGRSQTPAERLRAHLRSTQRARRELDRERVKLEGQEKTLMADIKKNAKQGQMVRTLAHPGGLQSDGPRFGARAEEHPQILPNEYATPGG